MPRRKTPCLFLLLLVLAPSCRTDNTATAQSTRSTEPAPTASAKPWPELVLGQTAELPGFRMRFVSQRDCGSPESGVPSAGNRLWAVELELSNVSQRALPANPFHVTLEDEQHHKYTTSLVGCSPILVARLLEPGERVRGYIPFEIPSSVRKVQLSYRPVLSDSMKPEARFIAEL